MTWAETRLLGVPVIADPKVLTSVCKLSYNSTDFNYYIEIKPCPPHLKLDLSIYSELHRLALVH